MDRRHFLNYTGLASLISTEIILPTDWMAKNTFPDFSNFNELAAYLLKLNDVQVPNLLDLQERNPDSKYFGGVCDAWKIYNPGSTAGLIKGLVCSFFHPDSIYFLDDKLAESIELAAKYLLKIQHTDGTIDLLSTNFHSTPDTAFVVEPLWAAYHLLKENKYPRQNTILKLLKEFMLNAGEALVVGGIHTPNHRWVVSAVLAMLNHSFPDERYTKRISEWLNEGVDIDDDGQYEERSTYIYTPLTNRCLQNIAMYDNHPELYEIIDKNLEMMMYYVHPNGEVATEASGRQDQFQLGFMEHYYISYRMAAMRGKGNEIFWAMVALIERTVPEKLLSYLPYFYTIPGFGNEKLQEHSAEIPKNYIKEFPHSKLVRIRRGEIDASILGGNPTFFTLSKGNAVLASVRLASAFFGRGQFISEKVEKTGDSFVMKWVHYWGYFQPLPENQKPNYEIPFDQDRKRRKQSEKQKLFAEIVFSERNGIFELSFELHGTKNVPLAIEFSFRKGGKVSGAEKLPDTNGAFLLKEGLASYNIGNDNIEFGPGKAEHSWITIRGGLPKPDGESVYITGFTPFKHSMKFG
jgi:hypothetical protein